MCCWMTNLIQNSPTLALLDKDQKRTSPMSPLRYETSLLRKMIFPSGRTWCGWTVRKHTTYPVPLSLRGFFAGEGNLRICSSRVYAHGPLDIQEWRIQFRNGVARDSDRPEGHGEQCAKEGEETLGVGEALHSGHTKVSPRNGHTFRTTVSTQRSYEICIDCHPVSYEATQGKTEDDRRGRGTEKGHGNDIRVGDTRAFGTNNSPLSSRCCHNHGWCRQSIITVPKCWEQHQHRRCTSAAKITSPEHHKVKIPATISKAQSSFCNTPASSSSSSSSQCNCNCNDEALSWRVEISTLPPKSATNAHRQRFWSISSSHGNSAGKTNIHHRKCTH